MRNKLVIAVVLLGLILIGIGASVLLSKKGDVPPEVESENSNFGTSPKDATYRINGQVVTLVDGFAETEAAPGSASKIVTRYFGNEVKTDLDGDHVEDVAFILTQKTGGSGVFYYAVGAVMTKDGYVGTDGYLLGDRIAPQSTNISQNPRHKEVVVFNYVDRAPNEPMTAAPSIGKSVYLKLVPETMNWAIVEPDFEGESA